MVAFDRDSFFLVTSSAVVGCSVFAILPLLGRQVAGALFYNALITSFVALAYHTYYRNAETLKAAGVKAALASAQAANNFQLAVFCLFWFFMGGGPSAAQLVPVAAPALVQALVSAKKVPAVAGSALWARAGSPLLARLTIALPQLLAACAMMEIVPVFLLVLRLRVLNAFLYAREVAPNNLHVRGLYPEL